MSLMIGRLHHLSNLVFKSKAIGTLKFESASLILLLVNAAAIRFVTFKMGVDPQSVWYGLDTRQYVDMVITPMIERTDDLNRHPMFSLLLAGPTILLGSLLSNIALSFLLATFIVTVFVSYTFYALFRFGGIGKCKSSLSTIICINLTSSLYFLPVFEMMSFTMGCVALSYLLVFMARRREPSILKVFLIVLSISIPMMATTPLGIIGVIGGFLYLSRSEFLHSIVYAYFLVSSVFVVQNLIFPTTNFFLNRPPGYYVAEQNWSYFFEAPVKWVGSTFPLPVLLRDPAPPFFQPLDSVDLDLTSLWGLLAISWTLILVYFLGRTWRNGDKFSVISILFLMLLVQLWGSEPHLQAPYLFPIFAYLFFMNLKDDNSSRFVKVFSYFVLIVTICVNLKTFQEAVNVLQNFNN